MKKMLDKILFYLLLIVLFFATTSIADAKTLKMYALYPEDSYLTQGLVNAAEQIKKETNGKINIKVFPSGQLGGYEEITDEVRRGTVEFAATWLTKRYHPRLDMLNAPGYAPLGYDQLAKVCFAPDSIFVKEIEQVLKELNIHSIGAWPEPYASIAFAKNKKPDSYSGFENKKRNLRVPAMPIYRDTYTAMGYQTVTIEFSETMSALQTGQVDGSTGQTLENVYLVGKDIFKHVDYNKLVCPPAWMICNEKLWNSFSKDEQKIISNAFLSWAQKTLAKMEEMDGFYLKKLRELGIEVKVYDQQEYYDIAKEIRKSVYPKYYDALGKDFMVRLDEYITSMRPVK